ncbi:MBL fold metallo-hydrolase [Streptomyces sp. NPDC004008]
MVAVLITHGHADHRLGLARLLERFPQGRGLATVLTRAAFDATNAALQKHWYGLFPGDPPTAVSKLCPASSGSPLRTPS